MPVDRLPLTLGRDRANAVVLGDRYVSGRHAEVVGYDDGHAVRDLGSSNGTALDGEPLAPGALTPLVDGATLRLGDAEVVYRAVRVGSGPAGDARRADGSPAVSAATRVLGWATGRVEPVARPDPGREAPASPTGASASRPAPARRGAGRAVRAVVALGLWLAVVVGLIGGAAWLLAPPRVALLVLGSDARPDEVRHGAVGRTDTLLAVVADRAPAGLALISIPRDVWVEVPGYGGERINAAYELGGLRTAERAAANLLGVPIDRALVIGLQGVREVVDAAGGIEVDVPRAIHDDAYPTDDYGTIVLDIPAGRQRMDGETALRYARTRHQDSDFGRMARQQQVLAALRGAVLHPANWWRAPSVLMAVRRTTASDLGPLDLVTLAFAAGGAAEPARLALDLAFVEEFQGQGGAYLLRPRPTLKARVAAFVTPLTAAVEVLNGSRTNGLAGQAAARLREQRLQVVRVGNAARPYAETVVEVRPGYGRAGRYVAGLLDLPPAAVRETPGLPDDVDARIILGG